MTVESSCLDFPLNVRNASTALHQSRQNKTKGHWTFADSPLIILTGLVGVVLGASPTTKNCRILNQLEFSFTSLVFRKKNWLKYSFDSLLYRTSNKRKQLNFAISISGRRYWVPIILYYLQKLENILLLVSMCPSNFVLTENTRFTTPSSCAIIWTEKNNIKWIQTSKAMVKRT